MEKVKIMKGYDEKKYEMVSIQVSVTVEQINAHTYSQTLHRSSRVCMGILMVALLASN